MKRVTLNSTFQSLAIELRLKQTRTCTERIDQDDSTFRMVYLFRQAAIANCRIQVWHIGGLSLYFWHRVCESWTRYWSTAPASIKKWLWLEGKRDSGKTCNDAREARTKVGRNDGQEEEIKLLCVQRESLESCASLSLHRINPPNASELLTSKVVQQVVVIALHRQALQSVSSSSLLRSFSC